jgi:hypothetical protein
MKNVRWLLFILLSVPLPALAQISIGSRPAASPLGEVAASAAVIHLGSSAVTLPGPWKFAPGDSPLINGVPEWSQPGFDDSKWALMNVAPKDDSVDPAYGTSGFVPGWISQGFPNLDGYAWYRLRIRVVDNGQRLWIKMPNDVDDAYQVYANSHFVGQFGQFSPHGVTVYSARTFSFPLPAASPDGTITLAIRFYMTASTRFQSHDAGGMHQPPAIGLASTVHLLQSADNDSNLHFYLGVFLQMLLYLLVIPFALWGWLQNKQDSTYLWLTCALSASVLAIVLLLIGNLTSVISLGVNMFFLDVILHTLELPLWIAFWWKWFGLEKKDFLLRAVWILTALRMLTLLCLRAPVCGINLVPLAWLSNLNILSTVWLSVLGTLLLITLIEGFRREPTEALAATVPIALIEYSSFAVFLLNNFGISSVFIILGVGISSGAVAGALIVPVIGVLALRRFLRTQVTRELAAQAIAKDIEQAQQLQLRVLVPEVLHSFAYAVETEYRPAQTVGGDFFQTLEKPDGSLLVVIGDVSGKGVSAAMLVAVLVGAIRTRADESFEPSSMLAMLNSRLVGRSGGHMATCLAAELRPNGEIWIANAGHLPPYLNGREVELEGSLPLGVVEGAMPAVQSFQLKPGDRLTFLTDGVVEATSQSGELFGFERARDVSHRAASVVVQQAQTFGQEDDITVLGVVFAPAAV